MISESLSGTWRFCRADQEGEWLPASVPGGVFTDLMAAGRIPDPFERDHEKQVQWVGEHDWVYERSFTPGAALLARERVELVFDGVDTLAEVWLNGERLGETVNMFRAYRWEVKGRLRPGENRLRVVFHAPSAHIRAMQALRRLPVGVNPGMAHLRKVQSHFGWDWGPALAGVGLWQAARLEGWDAARLDDVHARQRHADGRVTLSMAVSCELAGAPGDLRLEWTLRAPDGGEQTAATALVNGAGEGEMMVEHPRLWQPNGLGEQPLYRLRVALRRGDELLDERELQVGLRTIELRREPDEWGESFTFVVNGNPIFARGANWIPADAFVTRLTPERLEHLVSSAARAHMNMLRVWGGGFYESEAFYDLCDRYGILVWQDFQFACSPYPLEDEAFLENVRAEVSGAVRRLRHRASLALWCGNNEIESMWVLFRAGKALGRASERFFYDALAGWVRAEDPDRPYWPGSPSSGGFRQAPQDQRRGDTHIWAVWHGLEAPEFYESSLTRFCSEFGLESLPALETAASFGDPQDLRLSAPLLLHRQRSEGGNEKLLAYVMRRFRAPAEFADLVYLTQIAQAEAVRAGVEHWRRNRPRCSGALYWQLNDCWPATSWSSIDYHGRWKALHYAARRFNAPAALSLRGQGGRVSGWLSNETPARWEGEARWTVETRAGERLAEGLWPAAVDPFGAARLGEVDCSDILRRAGRDLVFTAELWQGGEPRARQVRLFQPERQMDWPDPGLEATALSAADGLARLRVRAAALARFVELKLEGVDTIFSDNYFDLPAGRAVEATCPVPADWDVERVNAALRARSLAGIRPARPHWLDQLDLLRIQLKPGNLLTRVGQRWFV